VVAKARPIEGLREEEPYAAAAAKVVAVRARELADHSRNVLDTDDIERVHDMRVASRRLRAALEIFEPCFPEAQHEEALSEVKAVADALGERRDADVTIAALEQFTENLAAPDRRGVSSLIARVRVEQAEANDRLEAFVQPLHLAALSERLSELAVEAEGVAAEEPA
jgi:CHAD domain-containing protein